MLCSTRIISEMASSSPKSALLICVASYHASSLKVEAITLHVWLLSNSGPSACACQGSKESEGARVILPGGFDCTSRYIRLRIERAKSHQQAESRNARACALTTFRGRLVPPWKCEAGDIVVLTS